MRRNIVVGEVWRGRTSRKLFRVTGFTRSSTMVNFTEVDSAQEFQYHVDDFRKWFDPVEPETPKVGQVWYHKASDQFVEIVDVDSNVIRYTVVGPDPKVYVKGYQQFLATCTREKPQPTPEPPKPDLYSEMVRHATIVKKARQTSKAAEIYMRETLQAWQDAKTDAETAHNAMRDAEWQYATAVRAWEETV